MPPASPAALSESPRSARMRVRSRLRSASSASSAQRRQVPGLGRRDVAQPPRVGIGRPRNRLQPLPAFAGPSPRESVRKDAAHRSRASTRSSLMWLAAIRAAASSVGSASTSMPYSRNARAYSAYAWSRTAGSSDSIRISSSFAAVSSSESRCCTRRCSSSSPPAVAQDAAGLLDLRHRLGELVVRVQRLGPLEELVDLERSPRPTCRPVGNDPPEASDQDQQHPDQQALQLTSAPLFRRANFRNRYPTDGGHGLHRLVRPGSAARRPRSRWPSRTGGCGPSPAPSSRSSRARRGTCGRQLRAARMPRLADDRRHSAAPSVRHPGSAGPAPPPG